MQIADPLMHQRIGAGQQRHPQCDIAGAARQRRRVEAQRRGAEPAGLDLARFDGRRCQFDRCRHRVAVVPAARGGHGRQRLRSAIGLRAKIGIERRDPQRQRRLPARRQRERACRIDAQRLDLQRRVDIGGAVAALADVGDQIRTVAGIHAHRRLQTHFQRQPDLERGFGHVEAVVGVAAPRHRAPAGEVVGHDEFDGAGFARPQADVGLPQCGIGEVAAQARAEQRFGVGRALGVANAVARRCVQAARPNARRSIVQALQHIAGGFQSLRLDLCAIDRQYRRGSFAPSEHLDARDSRTGDFDPVQSFIATAETIGWRRFLLYHHRRSRLAIGARTRRGRCGGRHRISHRACFIEHHLRQIYRRRSVHHIRLHRFFRRLTRATPRQSTLPRRPVPVAETCEERPVAPFVGAHAQPTFALRIEIRPPLGAERPHRVVEDRQRRGTRRTAAVVQTDAQHLRGCGAFLVEGQCELRRALRARHGDGHGGRVALRRQAQTVRIDAGIGAFAHQRMHNDLAASVGTQRQQQLVRGAVDGDHPAVEQRAFGFDQYQSMRSGVGRFQQQTRRRVGRGRRFDDLDREPLRSGTVAVAGPHIAFDLHRRGVAAARGEQIAAAALARELAGRRGAGDQRAAGDGFALRVLVAVAAETGQVFDDDFDGRARLGMAVGIDHHAVEA